MSFDFQWANLPSPDTEYNPKRITELLDYTGLKRDFFKGKECLDAGCGSGRWTWAMQQMGAHVNSIDISLPAVALCKRVNPIAYMKDIMELEPTLVFDFTICWGVLHHMEFPREGFKRISGQVRHGGLLHIMVYHRDTQKQYESARQIWKTLTQDERLALCEQKAKEIGGTVHGWWDALNPTYNWGFHEDEVKEWFKQEGYEDIKLVKKHNINMRGRKK